MSVVPLIPLRRVDDLITRIEELTKDAERRGFGTLAYFLETALTEARIEQRRLLDEKAARNADPRDLWTPETRPDV
ncbi:hypothetical protein [Bosea sp. 685]|uniref:hypothetical protein n=1 Tax=Bosea sp. 685 TaxID=3080057 RepID=UPI002892E5A1|nr:hypothetical protein [Bosea sp. 685]WNJ89623.1 hypothetical protein RMR04_24970 [Bosea sp. 685]